MDEVSTMKCADSTLSVYGKLPCYAEYIKIRCTDGPGRGFREWLDAAAQGPGARLGTRWRAWTLRPGGETVCAAFRDSADAIGRSFPFSCHASGMTTPATGSLSQHILEASAIWEELEQWDAAIAREKHLDSVRSVALGWRLHGREPAAGAASARPLEVGPLPAFARRLFAETSGWDAWIGFLWELRQALLRLRGMTGSVAESRLPALCIPLATGNDLLAQSWMWARVLDESGIALPGGGGRGPAIQALAMPSGAVRNAALWLFPRPLVASDYKALTLPTAGILRPAPADRTHDDPAGYAQFRSRLELLMRRDDATMADLASFRLLP